MANKEIPDLTVGDKIVGSEVFHGVQLGNSRKLSARSVADLGLGVATEAGTAVTAVADDNGDWIRFTAATAIVWTIDEDIFGVGDEITFEQAGNGVVTVTAGANVTINARGDRFNSNGLYSVATLKCVANNDFILVGDLV